MMLTIRDDTGAVVSLMINVFFNVWVKSVKPYGPGEEQIVFVARSKKAELRVP